jgi:hypothetical protein
MKIKQVTNYMALLRNLRNIIRAGVSDKHMKMVVEAIHNPEAVEKSKQFPYRFLSAYKELENEPGSTKVLAALSDAVELSVQNIPEFTGKTFVTCDTSRSMDGAMSSKSKMTRREVGCLFGAMVHKKSEDAITSVFATDFVPVNLNARDSMFTNLKKMFDTDTNGYGTEAWKIMDYLNKHKVFVDRIIMFSDMQCYDAGHHMYGDERSFYEGLVKYRKNVNKNVFVYSFDLASYGTLQVPNDDPRVCIAGGFSDKVLNFIPMFEGSRTNMLDVIENIRI